jgi:hypothetical protein
MALFRALDTPGSSGRIFNAADYAPVAAVELHQLAGVEPPTTEATNIDTDPWFGIVSTRRIRTELGFRPLYPSVYAAQDAGAL